MIPLSQFVFWGIIASVYYGGNRLIRSVRGPRQPKPLSGGFKNTIFSGSRFLFWAIVPIGAVGLGSMNYFPAAKNQWIVWILDVLFILFAVALWNPTRFRPATRLVALIVFLGYAVRLFDSIVHLPSDVRDSVLGLIFIGGPCVIYAMFGAFSKHSAHIEWRNRLFHANDDLVLREAFLNAIRLDRIPDIETCRRALTSAEVVAATDGYKSISLAPAMYEWSQLHRKQIKPELASLALQALDAARLNPDLQNAWDSDEPEEYEAVVADLREHLVVLASAPAITSPSYALKRNGGSPMAPAARPL